MENEIPSVNRVDDIRERLADLKGKRLRVKANMGRSRIVERAGTLVNVHPSLIPASLSWRSRSAAAVPRASPSSMSTS